MILADRDVVGVAALIWVVAWWASSGSGLPSGIGVVAALIVVSAVVVRWPARDSSTAVLLLVMLLVLAGWRSHQTWSDLHDGDAGEWQGSAVLVSDPEPVAGGVRLRMRLTGSGSEARVVDARAWGGAAGMLRARLMGEVVAITGSVRTFDEIRPWQAARGVSAAMTVDTVDHWRTGGTLTRIANSVRRTIEGGASGLSRDQRSLLAGLVYGDDREQSTLTADDFQGAGLTHLLAVSGQNVAFVLVIAGPVLRRFSFRGRFLATLVVVLAFATLTRFEPSVVRASMMTAVSAFALVAGRPANSLRVLALAVSGLVLISPMIVHAVAFQLSVAASLGILLISPQIVPLLRGPRPLAEAVAVTAGAQLAVAPLQVWLFGGLPVASLPANILAGPTAGPAMMWGLTAGWIAGLVPQWLASVLHLPSRVLLWWIAGVARLASWLPLGQLGAWSLVGLAITLMVIVLRPNRVRRRWGGLLVVLVLIAPGIRLSVGGPAEFAVDAGSRMWHVNGIAVLELDTGTSDGILLEQLREHGVRSIDLVVAKQGTRRSFTQVSTLRGRWSPVVWAPPGHRVSGAHTVGSAQTIGADGDRLEVAVVERDLRTELVVTEG